MPTIRATAAQALVDFDDAIARLLSSGDDDARDNIARILHLTESIPTLAAILAALPHPQELTAPGLKTALYNGEFKLPKERDKELATVMKMLHVIANDCDTPFWNYTLRIMQGADADDRASKFAYKLINPALQYLRALLQEALASDIAREKAFGSLEIPEEQQRLLLSMVEAFKSTPRESKHKFMFRKYMGSSVLLHKGFPEGKLEAYAGDLEALAREELITISTTGQRTTLIDITSRGHQYYEYCNSAHVQELRGTEETVTAYLDGIRFRQLYPEAYSKWSSANKTLRALDAHSRLTETGHLAREAMQEFAESAIRRLPNVPVSPNKANTVTRIRSLLDRLANRLGETEKPFLDALLVYWGTVSDLVQRQEHGNQKEGKPLTWEDARRVVFHTGIVMYEIDRVLSRR